MHANAAADEVAEANGLLAVDRRLAALCRERGPLRALLACIARRLVGSEAWERLGYARALRLFGRTPGFVGAMGPESRPGWTGVLCLSPPGGGAGLRDARLDEGAPAGQLAARRMRPGVD